MRLIDADALLKTLTVFDEKYTLQKSDVFHHIENAPTVQREGWLSVPIEPTEEMINKCLVHCYSRDDVIQSYQAMIQAAPTDKE